MLFGDKSKFGLEIEVNEIYGNEFIGDGFFVVYIDNICYGKRDKYATTFVSIVNDLLIFYSNLKNTNTGLENYSKEEIAICFYCQGYSDANLSKYKYELLEKTKYLYAWNPDEAFDDGSWVMHFDDDEKTRIIGFKSCMLDDVNSKVIENSVHEITIPRKDFRMIVYDAYKFLKSYGSSYSKR